MKIEIMKLEQIYIYFLLVKAKYIKPPKRTLRKPKVYRRYTKGPPRGKQGKENTYQPLTKLQNLFTTHPSQKIYQGPRPLYTIQVDPIPKVTQKSGHHSID